MTGELDVAGLAEVARAATPGRLCEVEGCPNPHRAKGLCGTHWSRLARRGTLEKVDQWMSGPARLWDGVEKTDSCWLWRGRVNADGYGGIMIAKKQLRVHRYAWELLRGPIPDELVLDHVCRNRCCVNPEHLEPVTNQANILRGIGITAINARKTHCKHGHEFTPENTYTPPSAPGRRVCRACMKATDRRTRARRQQKNVGGVA